MGLLTKLYRFAQSGKSHQEDALTEVWAHLFRLDPGLRTAISEAVLCARPAPPGWPDLAQARVETQMAVKGTDGQGFCDLVFSDNAGSRLIVEVKVGAPLGMRRTEDEDGAEAWIDQLTKYLRVAARDPATYVISLGLAWSQVPASVRDHERYRGALTWQDLHDFTARRLSDLPEHQCAIASEALGLLEELKLATPKMTFDGLLSVYSYTRFYDSFCSAMQAALDRVDRARLLNGFRRPTDRQWQEHSDRIGYPLAAAGFSEHFAFMGLWHGEGSIHPEIPDLYFFYEVPEGSAEASFLEARGSDIAEMLLRIQTTPGEAVWRFEAGGYETIHCTMSMVEVVRQADPAKAIGDFFEACLRTEEPRKLFFAALEAGG